MNSKLRYQLTRRWKEVGAPHMFGAIPSDSCIKPAWKAFLNGKSVMVWNERTKTLGFIPRK